RQGVFWVGSFNGLNKVNDNAPRFRTYRFDPDDDNSLINNSVWTFEEDQNGDIWIGTEDGISILNRKTEKFSRLHSNPNQANSLSGNQIRTIRKDKENNLWIGTRYDGLNRYDPQKKEFTHFSNDPKNPESLPDDFVL